MCVTFDGLGHRVTSWLSWVLEIIPPIPQSKSSQSDDSTGFLLIVTTQTLLCSFILSVCSLCPGLESKPCLWKTCTTLEKNRCKIILILQLYVLKFTLKYYAVYWNHSKWLWNNSKILSVFYCCWTLICIIFTRIFLKSPAENKTLFNWQLRQLVYAM